MAEERVYKAMFVPGEYWKSLGLTLKPFEYRIMAFDLEEATEYFRQLASRWWVGEFKDIEEQNEVSTSPPLLQN